MRNSWIGQLFAELELANLCDHHPNILSGGQKQCLAIAAVVAADKKLLISMNRHGLGYDSIKRVSSLFHNLADRNKPVFVVTYDMELIAEAYTRMLFVGGHSLVADFPVFAATTPTPFRLLHMMQGKPVPTQTEAPEKGRGIA